MKLPILNLIRYFWHSCESYYITRIRSVERSICPIAAQNVSVRLPRTSVSGHMSVYYAKKVAQYAQNPEVKGLTYEDFEILRIKCIEVTTLTFQGHVTSSTTWPFDSNYVVSYRWSVDTCFLSSTVTEIFWSTCPILSQACTFPLKLAYHDFLGCGEGIRGFYHFFNIQGLAATERRRFNYESL